MKVVKGKNSRDTSIDRRCMKKKEEEKKIGQHFPIEEGEQFPINFFTRRRRRRRER